MLNYRYVVLCQAEGSGGSMDLVLQIREVGKGLCLFT